VGSGHACIGLFACWWAASGCGGCRLDLSLPAMGCLGLKACTCLHRGWGAKAECLCSRQAHPL